MDPATIALLGAAINAGGSLAAGHLNRRGQRETGEQKRDRNIIDQIMQGIQGQGPYANLFSADEDQFNRQFADPARSRFENITAPGIQQQFIGSGQHLGTGLEDELIRAGVDMDTLLNQQFGEFQQSALDRQSNALSGIIGQRTGAQEGFSSSDALKRSAAGHLSGPGFQQDLSGILRALGQRGNSIDDQASNSIPKGYSR